MESWLKRHIVWPYLTTQIMYCLLVTILVLVIQSRQESLRNSPLNTVCDVLRTELELNKS